MEDYECKVSNYMQLYSRIVANLLVMLAKTLVSLPVKPTNIRLGGGAMGGPTPSTSLSQTVFSPQYGDLATRHGETIMRLMRPMGDPRREIERLPLYDFRFFPGLSWENSILDYQSSRFH